MKDDNKNSNVKKFRVDENESDSDEEFNSTEEDAASDLSEDVLSDAEEAAESYTILKASDFEWQSLLWGPPKSKLVIFASKNKDFCYEFSRYHQSWYCRGCKKQNAYVGVKIVKNEAGEDCVKVINENHVCDPVAYTPEVQYHNLMASDFELRSNKNGVPNKSLVIFSKDDRSQYYKFQVNGTVFVCISCRKSGKHLSAKLMKNENGQEYIKMMDREHICQPRLLLQPKNYKPPKKAPSETEVFYSPDFELSANRNGVPNSLLTIYASEDRKTCWNFYLKEKSYRCIECSKLNTCTTAWLRKKSDKQFIEIRTSHVCKPMKCEPLTTIPSSQFELTTVGRRVPDPRLNLFTSPDKTSYYQFYLSQGNFHCCGCLKQKKTTIVKLMKNENGEDYVQMKAEVNHVCKPIMGTPKLK